jgi:hypothetical protein
MTNVDAASNNGAIASSSIAIAGLMPERISRINGARSCDRNGLSNSLCSVLELVDSVISVRENQYRGLLNRYREGASEQLRSYYNALDSTTALRAEINIGLAHALNNNDVQNDIRNLTTPNNIFSAALVYASGTLRFVNTNYRNGAVSFGLEIIHAFDDVRSTIQQIIEGEDEVPERQSRPFRARQYRRVSHPFASSSPNDSVVQTKQTRGIKRKGEPNNNKRNKVRRNAEKQEQENKHNDDGGDEE